MCWRICRRAAIDDLRCGNIILLHDGGGDRAETVRALPMIIEGIRAHGYEIVPVYELLGMQKADVMAPLPRGELWAARLDRSASGCSTPASLRSPGFSCRRRADDRSAAIHRRGGNL